MSAVPRKKLGRFEIVRVLGKGAMGIVYEGLDPRLNRRVAIKTILHSAILDEEESRDYAQRFVREAQAVAKLTHPHIVGVYDFGDEDDITFIVMEYIDGKEMKAYFDAGHRFDFPSSVRLMSELLDAMGYAHKQGVIHRDIKPANIMLDSQMRVKITDFGVARITESAERTQVGTMVGTPSYMSPEQIQGLSTDNRTDLFACGVILYQMITGEKPFAGAGTWTIYNQILQQDPRRPTEMNMALPPAIDQVISKALAKNKDDRFRNAQEFTAALTSLLEGNDGSFGPDDTVVFMPGRARPKPDPSLSLHPRHDTGASVRPAKPGHEMELEFWRAVKDSTDPDEFETYLDAFPDGVYAKLAESKIRRLRGAGMQTDVGGSSVSEAKSEVRTPAPSLTPAPAPTPFADTAAADEAAALAEREQQRKQRELEARRIAEEKARQLTEEKRKADERKAAEAKRLKEQAEAEAQRAKERARVETEEKRKSDERKAVEAAEAKRLKEQADVEAQRAKERARVEAEEKRQSLQAQAATQAEEEAKRKAALAESKRQAEAEAKRIADADAARKAAEERAKADAEATAKAERLAAEARRKAAEEEARRKSEDEARRQAAEEATARAEQEARRKAEEEARLKAAEEERLKHDRARAEVTVRREPVPNTVSNDETVMMKAAPLVPAQAEAPLPATPPAQVRAPVAEPVQAPPKSGPPIALIGGGAALVLAIGGWFLMSSGSKAPESVKPLPSPAQQQAPIEPAAVPRPADAASKGQQDDAARRERTAADKAAADRAAAAAKADAEKAAAREAQDRATKEKAAAAERAAADKAKEAKGAAQKGAPDKGAAERAAAEKATADRANAEKAAAAERAAAADRAAAAERAVAAEKAAAAERAAAERAAAEKAAADRAAADKAAAAAKAQAERSAAEKAAAERAGVEKAAAEREAAAKSSVERAPEKAAPKGRAAPARQN